MLRLWMPIIIQRTGTYNLFTHITLMYNSQTNPESPARPPPSKYVVSAPSPQLAFLAHSMRQIKETDQCLKEGIQDARARLLGHLKLQQGPTTQIHQSYQQVRNESRHYRHVVGGIAGSQASKPTVERKVVVNNYYTPVAQSSTMGLKTVHFTHHTAGFENRNTVQSQPTSPASHFRPVLQIQSKETMGVNASMEAAIGEKNQQIKKLENEIRLLHIKIQNISLSARNTKIECLDCKKHLLTIHDLQQKLRQDTARHAHEVQMMTAERDGYRLKLANLERDKKEELASLETIIAEFKKKEGSTQEKYKFTNDSTRSQNLASVKLELEELKYKNNHLSKRVKEKTQKITELQLLLEQQGEVVRKLGESRGQQEQQETDFDSKYRALLVEFEGLRELREREAEEHQRKIDRLNQRLQETEVHNQNMFNEVTDLNELVEEYRQQNGKLKLLHEKQQTDMGRMEEELGDLHALVEELKGKNMETVEEYNELVQKYEVLEEKTKKYSYLQTEVSSQVSGKRSHKHSDDVCDKKERELNSKIENLERQIELIQRQKEAEIGERKVYEGKSRELYEKLRELNEENHKLRCTIIRDEDSQQSEIVEFNKDKIDSLLSPNVSHAGSIHSWRYNDREFMEKDKVVEKVEVQKHALELEEIKTKVEALMKKVEVLGGHLSGQHRLLRQESSKSKYKQAQVEIGAEPSMSPSPRSRTKLHRHSESNAQIEFIEQEPQPEPLRQKSGQLAKMQNEIYSEWKEWSIEMSKISKQLEAIIEEQNLEKHILAEQIQELSLEKARVYGNLSNAEKYIERLNAENHDIHLQLDSAKIEVQQLREVIKQKQEAGHYAKKESEANAERWKEEAKLSQRVQTQNEVYKAQIESLSVNVKEWERHYQEAEDRVGLAEQQIGKLRDEVNSLKAIKAQIQDKTMADEQAMAKMMESHRSQINGLQNEIELRKTKLKAKQLSSIQKQKALQDEIKVQAEKLHQLETVHRRAEENSEGIMAELEKLQVAHERLREEHSIYQRIADESQQESIQKSALMEKEMGRLTQDKHRAEEGLVKAEDYIEVLLKEVDTLKQGIMETGESAKREKASMEQIITGQYEAKLKDKDMAIQSIHKNHEEKIISVTRQYEQKISQVTKQLESKLNQKDLAIEEIKKGYEMKMVQAAKSYESKLKEKDLIAESIKKVSEEKKVQLIRQFEGKLREKDLTIEGIKRSNEGKDIQAARKHEEKMIETVRRYEDKLREKELAIETMRKNLEGKSIQMVKHYEAKLKQKDLAIASINNNHEQTMIQVVKQYQEKSLQAIKQFEQKLRETELVIQEIKKNNEKRIIEITRNKEQKLIQTARHFESKLKEKDLTIESIQKGHEQRTISIGRQYQDKLKEKDIAMNSMKKNYEDKASEISRQYQERMKGQTELARQTGKQYEETIKRERQTRQVLEAELNKLTTEKQRAHQNLIKAQNYIESILSERVKEVEQIQSSTQGRRMELVAELDRKTAEHQKEVRELQTRLDSNLNAIKSINEDFKRKQSQLVSQSSLISKLESEVKEASRVAKQVQAEASKKQLAEKQIADRLRQQLKKEQQQHQKVFEGLAKAEDHIIQLYSDIEVLKAELEAKRNQLLMAQQQKRQQLARAQYQNLRKLAVAQEVAKKQIALVQQSQSKSKLALENKKVSILEQQIKKKLEILEQQNRRKLVLIEEQNKRRLAAIDQQHRKSIAISQQQNKKKLAMVEQEGKRRVEAIEQQNRQHVLAMKEEHKRQLLVAERNYEGARQQREQLAGKEQEGYRKLQEAIQQNQCQLSIVEQQNKRIAQLEDSLARNQQQIRRLETELKQTKDLQQANASLGLRVGQLEKESREAKQQHRRETESMAWQLAEQQQISARLRAQVIQLESRGEQAGTEKEELSRGLEEMQEQLSQTNIKYNLEKLQSRKIIQQMEEVKQQLQAQLAATRNAEALASRNLEQLLNRNRGLEETIRQLQAILEGNKDKEGRLTEEQARITRLYQEAADKANRLEKELSHYVGQKQSQLQQKQKLINRQANAIRGLENTRESLEQTIRQYQQQLMERARLLEDQGRNLTRLIQENSQAKTRFDQERAESRKLKDRAEEQSKTLSRIQKEHEGQMSQLQSSFNIKLDSLLAEKQQQVEAMAQTVEKEREKGTKLQRQRQSLSAQLQSEKDKAKASEQRRRSQQLATNENYQKLVVAEEHIAALHQTIARMESEIKAREESLEQVRREYETRLQQSSQVISQEQMFLDIMRRQLQVNKDEMEVKVKTISQIENELQCEREQHLRISYEEQAAKEEVYQLRAQLSDNKQAVTSLSQQLHSKEVMLDRLVFRLEEIESIIDGQKGVILRSGSRTQQFMVEAIEDKVAHLKSKIQSSQHEKLEASRLKGQIRQLEEDRAIKESRIRAIEEEQAQKVFALNSRIAEGQTAIHRLQSELVLSRQEHQTVFEGLAKAEDHIIQLYSDTEKLKGEIEAKESQIAKAEQVNKLILQAQSQLRRSQQEKKRLEDQVAQTKTANSILNKQRADLEEKVQRQAIEIKQVGIEKEVQANQKLIEQTKKQINEQTSSLKKEIGSLSASLSQEQHRTRQLEMRVQVAIEEKQKTLKSLEAAENYIQFLLQQSKRVQDSAASSLARLALSEKNLEVAVKKLGQAEGEREGMLGYIGHLEAENQWMKESSSVVAREQESKIGVLLHTNNQLHEQVADLMAKNAQHSTRFLNKELREQRYQEQFERLRARVSEYEQRVGGQERRIKEMMERSYQFGEMHGQAQRKYRQLEALDIDLMGRASQLVEAENLLRHSRQMEDYIANLENQLQGARAKLQQMGKGKGSSSPGREEKARREDESRRGDWMVEKNKVIAGLEGRIRTLEQEKTTFMNDYLVRTRQLEDKIAILQLNPSREAVEQQAASHRAVEGRLVQQNRALLQQVQSIQSSCRQLQTQLNGKAQQLARTLQSLSEAEKNREQLKSDVVRLQGFIGQLVQENKKHKHEAESVQQTAAALEADCEELREQLHRSNIEYSKCVKIFEEVTAQADHLGLGVELKSDREIKGEAQQVGEKKLGQAISEILERSLHMSRILSQSIKTQEEVQATQSKHLEQLQQQLAVSKQKEEEVVAHIGKAELYIDHLEEEKRKLEISNTELLQENARINSRLQELDGQLRDINARYTKFEAQNINFVEGSDSDREKELNDQQDQLAREQEETRQKDLAIKELQEKLREEVELREMAEEENEKLKTIMEAHAENTQFKEKVQELEQVRDELYKLIGQSEQLLEEERRKSTSKQDLIAELNTKLENEVRDKAEIFQDNVRLFGDLQQANERIALLEASLASASIDGKARLDDLDKLRSQDRLIIEDLKSKLETSNQQAKILQLKTSQLSIQGAETARQLGAELAAEREKAEAYRVEAKKTSEYEQKQRESLAKLVEELSSKLKQAEGALRKSAERQSQLSQKQKSQMETLAHKEQRITKLNIEMEKANKELNSAHHELEQTHTQIGSTMVILKKIQNQFKILSEVNEEIEKQLHRAHAENESLKEQSRSKGKENEEWRAKLQRAESHILYQEQYIEDMMKNEDRLAESEQRCEALQNKIVELEEHFKDLLSLETREKITGLDDDFRRLEDYFMRAVEDEKKKIYEVFISEHPERGQTIKLNKGELIVMGDPEENQRQAQLEEINRLNDKLMEVESKKHAVKEQLKRINTLKDNELRLGFAEKKIKELESELSRHQSNRTSMASSINLGHPEKDNKEKEEEEEDRNGPKEGERKSEKQRNAEIEVLRQTVYEQEEKLAILQQELKNKTLELQHHLQVQVQKELEKEKSEHPGQLKLQQDLVESHTLQEYKAKEEEFKAIINEQLKHIKSLSDQLNKESRESIAREAEVARLGDRLREEEEKYRQVNDKFAKEQHKLKQNFSIVEGIRNQLVEENGMLSQQVKRYEEIIAELQDREVEVTVQAPKSARNSVEVQALQAEVAQLRGRIQIMEEERAEQLKETQAKMEAMQNGSALLLQQKEALQQQAIQQQQALAYQTSERKDLEHRLRQLTKEQETKTIEHEKVKSAHTQAIEQIRRAEEERNALEGEVGNLSKELAHLRGQKERVEDRIRGLEEQHGALRDKYDYLSQCLEKLDEEIAIKPFEYIEQLSLMKPGSQKEEKTPEKKGKSDPESARINHTINRISQALRESKASNNELRQAHAELEQSHHKLKVVYSDLEKEVSMLNEQLRDYDNKMKMFEGVTEELEKELRDVYQRLADKDRKDEKDKKDEKEEAREELDRVRKEKAILEERLRSREHENEQSEEIFTRMTSKISQLEKKEADLLEDNRKISLKLEEVEKKLEDQEGEREVDQEIEKARLSLDQGFKKQKSERRSSLDKDRLTDRERIGMLERIIYQLEEQVKSFERSVETLTEELAVYQDKEAEWVDSQTQMADIIDFAERITVSLEKMREGQGESEQVDTEIPWLGRLSKGIRETVEGYRKELQAKTQQIATLKQSVVERGSEQRKERPQNVPESGKKSPESVESASQVIEERYEQLIKEYVMLEKEKRELEQEVGSLSSELQGYRARVDDLATAVISSSSENKSDLENLQLRKKLEEAEYKLLQLTNQKNASLLAQPVYGQPNYGAFLNVCLTKIEQIEENSYNLERELEEHGEKLSLVVDEVEGQEVSSVRKSQELVNQFRQLLYSEEKDEQKRQSPLHFIPELPLPEPQPQPSGQVLDLVGPINIGDRDELIRQIKELNELMDMYHGESEGVKARYLQVIKRVQGQINKLKEICVEIVGETGGEVVEGSATDRLILKVAQIMEKLTAEHEELVDSQALEKAEGLEVIQEDIQNESKSVNSPKSQKKEQHNFTPKSAWSQKEAQSHSPSPKSEREHMSKSIWPSLVEVAAEECQTSLEAKPFIDYLLDTNEFEKAELLALKRKIMSMRSRQDKANLDYLEGRSRQLEKMMREEERLPNRLRNSKHKLMEVLAFNTDPAELQALMESGKVEKVLDKIVDIIRQEKEEREEEGEEFVQFYETSVEKQHRLRFTEQANAIRLKYYPQGDSFSRDLLDCLVSLYQGEGQGGASSEEFLVVLDKILEVTFAMQQSYQRSLEQREKLVEGHSEVMKKLLEAQWQQDEQAEPQEYQLRERPNSGEKE